MYTEVRVGGMLERMPEKGLETEQFLIFRRIIILSYFRHAESGNAEEETSVLAAFTLKKL